MAAVDFRQACDSITHRSLWKALEAQNVPRLYINVLQRLYADQRGVIIGDKISREFAIRRGSKQGDKINPVLFNLVLEDIMKPLKVEWARAAPPFLKKATFGRFLMQVSMSASVTKPSLSTSSIFEY